jgi:predicted O-methyltransferase YrrM
MTDPYVAIDHYIDDLFAPEDEVLAAALADAKAADLPHIQVSAGQGKLLYLLAKLVGARRILEIGTLGGYSTIWLARALPEDGRLTTLELERKHADVAAGNLARAGLAAKTEIIVGPALQSLQALSARGEAPFDVVFIDADKASYPQYLAAVMRLVRPGALILGDNVIRSGAVLDPNHPDPNARGARAFNALLAADDRLEAVVLQQVGVKGHDGLAIARVR